jgi:hypothetical protein
MTERRTTRRYDLSLPVIIRIPTERQVDSQEELDITLTLPAEITHGTEVFVRALGKVVRVERRMEDGTARMGVAAVIERYDIIRGEAARA